MKMWPGMVATVLAAASPALAAQATPAAKTTPTAQTSPAAQASPKDVVVDRVTVDELKKMMRDDKVLVLDVRGAEAYREAHIPSSVSIPLGEIDKHVAELKSSKKAIVTYCS